MSSAAKAQTGLVPVLLIAALCVASTGAGVGAAAWFDRSGLHVGTLMRVSARSPASEPGRLEIGPSHRVSGSHTSALPTYKRGDRFDFAVREPASIGDPVSFERQFKVDQVRADRIDWSVGRASMTTTMNPFAPALNWRGTEEGEGTRQLLGDPLALFPLVKGKKAAVTSIGARDRWECEAAGVDQITVQAGTFRSWRIECANQTGTSKDTYYYSDELGFWVSRLSKYQRGADMVERIYELTSSNRLPL